MKKAFVLCLIAVLLVSFSGPVLAEGESPYEQVLNSINHEFDLELEYIPVDESKVSMEDYERNARELAIQQRELLDYISLREKQNISNNDSLFESSDFNYLSTITKTRTSNSWNHSAFFTITVTYDVNGNQVSSLRNARYDYTLAAIIAGVDFYSSSGPIYNIIDSGRTGTVKYNGVYSVNGIPYGNTYIYAEFTWDA